MPFNIDPIPVTSVVDKMMMRVPLLEVTCSAPVDSAIDALVKSKDWIECADCAKDSCLDFELGYAVESRAGSDWEMFSSSIEVRDMAEPTSSK